MAVAGVAVGYRQLTDEPDVPELQLPAAGWPDDAGLRDCSRVDSDVDDSGGMRGPAMIGDAIHQHQAWATYEPQALDAPGARSTHSPRFRSRSGRASSSSGRRAEGQSFLAVMPPSTTTTAPFVKLLAGRARLRMA